ncbi:MAG: hypothetical protein M1840_001426 [Geoglossum simile]|nr:MAG: hypothetical protein M1840_001426 [Geoglossum simile]
MACEFDTTTARNYILDNLENDTICSSRLLDSIHVSLRHSSAGPSAEPSAGPFVEPFAAKPSAAEAHLMEAWESFTTSKRSTERIFPALATLNQYWSQDPEVQVLAGKYIKEMIKYLAKMLWGSGCYRALGGVNLRVAGVNGGYRWGRFESDGVMPGVEFVHPRVRTCIIGVCIPPGEDVTACELFCLTAMAVKSHKVKRMAKSHRVRVLSVSPFSKYRILTATIPSRLLSELSKRECNFTVGFDIECSRYFDVLDPQELCGLIAAFFTE